MKARDIVILIVFLIFGLPLLIKFLIWSTGAAINPTTDNIEKGVELLADSAVPWWTNIIVFLAGGGIIGALLIIGLIYLLKWIGEVR